MFGVLRLWCRLWFSVVCERDAEMFVSSYVLLAVTPFLNTNLNFHSYRIASFCSCRTYTLMLLVYIRYFACSLSSLCLFVVLSLIWIRAYMYINSRIYFFSFSSFFPAIFKYLLIFCYCTYSACTNALFSQFVIILQFTLMYMGECGYLLTLFFI